MSSPDEVGNFQLLIAQIAAVAVARTTALMASKDDKAFVIDAYPVVLDPFIAGAGQVAAEWYQSLAPEKEFAVEMAPPPAKEILDANVRWALTQLDPIKALTGSAERQVFNGSRDTLLTNAGRERVRYARYASANACKFCQVLATKSDNFYRSEEAATRVVGRSINLELSDRRMIQAGFMTRDEALDRREQAQKVYVRGERQGMTRTRTQRGSRKIGQKYHDFCRCIPVPVRNGFYEPPPWVEKWDDDYKAARADGKRSLDDIVNHMRRSQYDGEKDMLNAARRERYAAKKAAKTQ